MFCIGLLQTIPFRTFLSTQVMYVKDVQGGIPKSDLLGVTVALIHVAGQRFLAV